MIYELAYEGGPSDGVKGFSPRPYSSLRDDEGHVYDSVLPEKDCLEWVDDDTRRIRLRYVGVMTKEEWSRRLRERPAG